MSNSPHDRTRHEHSSCYVPESRAGLATLRGSLIRATFPRDGDHVVRFRESYVPRCRRCALRQKENPVETGPVSDLGGALPHVTGADMPHVTGADICMLGGPSRCSLYRIDHFVINPQAGGYAAGLRSSLVGRNGSLSRSQCGCTAQPATGGGRLVSAPPGAITRASTLGAFLTASVCLVPRILDAEPTSPARRHHALFERSEGASGAVVAVAAAVLDAPRPIDLRGGRLDVERESCRRKQRKRDACHHLCPRKPTRLIEHPIATVVPGHPRTPLRQPGRLIRRAAL